jgi:hypothetical protein
MSDSFRLRGVAVLAALGVMGLASAVQAHDLTCTVRFRDKSFKLHFSDDQRTAAFGDDPAAPTTITENHIKWSGTTNGLGYTTTYDFERHTGTLVRTAPVLFDRGLTSMWPTTYDCAGGADRGE